MPKDQRGALESFRIWRDLPILCANNFRPSKGRSSMVEYASFGNPEKWNHKARHITMAVTMDCVAVSATSNEAVRSSMQEDDPQR